MVFFPLASFWQFHAQKSPAVWIVSFCSFLQTNHQHVWYQDGLSIEFDPSRSALPQLCRLGGHGKPWIRVNAVLIRSTLVASLILEWSSATSPSFGGPYDLMTKLLPVSPFPGIQSHWAAIFATLSCFLGHDQILRPQLVFFPRFPLQCITTSLYMCLMCRLDHSLGLLCLFIITGALLVPWDVRFLVSIFFVVSANLLTPELSVTTQS